MEKRRAIDGLVSKSQYYTIFLGIMDIIKPSITKLDDQVKNTRKSQLLLAGDITKLSECKFFKRVLGISGVFEVKIKFIELQD